MATSKRLSVTALVGELRGEGYSENEAVAALMVLQRERKLSIEESRPYAGFTSFAFSPLSIWFWTSIAAIAFSLALISVTSGAALYLRYMFGGSLVLFIPGFSLVEALYPRRELDGLTKVALSIGLSLALIPLIGLVLNYTPFGVRLVPVTLSIAGLAVVLLVVALSRKHAYYKLAKGVA